MLTHNKIQREGLSPFARLGRLKSLCFVTLLVCLSISSTRAEIIAAEWSGGLEGQTAVPNRGQTFTATVNGTLDSIYIEAQTWEGPPAFYEVNFFEVLSETTIGSIATTSIDVSALSTSPVWLQASFLIENYNLISGKKYGFNFSYDSEGFTKSVLVNLGAPNYEGGEMIDVYLESYGNAGPFDMNFRVTVSAIPEPSTYATIIGGLVLVVGMWRRVRKYRTTPSA